MMVILTIFLIFLPSVDNSFASQSINSDDYKTKYGTRFHYKITTPARWYLNQTYEVNIDFHLDEFGDNIDVIGGQIGLHVRDNNNFTHYYGFHKFGPFNTLQTFKEYIGLEDNENTFRFTIDLHIFDLSKPQPTILSFYLGYKFYETNLVQYLGNQSYMDSINQEAEWVEAARFQINPDSVKRSIPIWLWVVIIMLLVKFSNSKRRR